MDKLKIAWICSVSNPEIRSCLHTHSGRLEKRFMGVFRREPDVGVDSAIWNTNAINEMKHIRNVELHIISPARNLAGKRQDFTIEGIHYHYIRDENSSLLRKVVRYLFTRYSSRFKINRARICAVVDEVKPHLVHVIGAENPQYSLALLDLPRSVPSLLQLQALLATIANKTTGAQQRDYLYKAQLERQLIRRADYVGTCVPRFIDYIRSEVGRDVKIVNTTLAMAQVIDITAGRKEYDFVHFAATLGPSKATDTAIEAFALAHKLHPETTLDVIGGTTTEFKEWLESRIAELGIRSAVIIEGRLPTHDDVIAQIRQARFALLPLKVSIVPNTLHEAMANGLPVVTTVTPGTPALNASRESVLISPQGDAEDLARNMVRLLEEEGLADKLRMNAAQFERERSSNSEIIKHWVEVYQSIVRCQSDGTPVPREYLL